jgi:hypothetical protein
MTSPHHIAPDIDYVPLGKITVYAVTHAELVEIKRGSADSVFFACGMSCLSLCIPTALSMLVLPTSTPKVMSIYTAVAVLSGVAGVVLLLIWRRYKTQTCSTIETIMARKPPVGVQSPNSPLPPAMEPPDEG